MKMFLLSLPLIMLSHIAMSQELDSPIDPPEGMVVIGKRIPGASAPPPIMGGGVGMGSPSGGSANPGKGQGGGSKGAWTEVKNKKDKKDVNDKNKEKAKTGWAAELLKSAVGVMDSLSEFLEKWSEKNVLDDTIFQGHAEIRTPGGLSISISGCAGTTVIVGDGQPTVPKAPCSEFRITPVFIENESGVTEPQFIFSVTKVDACYTNVENSMKCIPLDNYTFVAKNKEELFAILNEVTGENTFH